MEKENQSIDQIKNFIKANKYYLADGKLNPSFLHQKKFLEELKVRLNINDENLLRQKIYDIMNDIIKAPLCPICGKSIPFSGKLYLGYNSACSKACSRKLAYVRAGLTKEKLYGPNWKNQEHAKRVATQKYLGTFSNGGEWTEERKLAQSTKVKNYWKRITDEEVKAIVNKRQETNLKKYGFTSNLKLPEIVKKAREGSLSENAKEKRARTRHSTFYKQLFAQIEKDYDLLFNVEDYDGVKERDYSFRCKLCNTTFECSLKDGHRPLCPKCYSKTGRSSFENEIVEKLNSLNLTVLKDNKTVISPLELDIFLPDYNLAIEANGNYYHSEVCGSKDRYYHLNKYNLCKEKNIRLIQIFEHEWLFKKDIVLSIIKSKLGMFDEKIGARDLERVRLTTSEAREFFDKNHLQGFLQSSHYFGLIKNGLIYSALSISKSRFKRQGFEITRFANKLNTKVSGSFSKLLHSSEEFKPLYSYADLRFFDGEVYEANGFTFLGQSSPNYFYVHKKNFLEVYSRHQFMKHKLRKKLDAFNSELSEWENMQLNGYDRLWDCGNKVFVLR